MLLSSRASTGGGNPSTVILSTGATPICLRKHLGGLKRQLEPLSPQAGWSWSKTMILALKRLIQLNLISTYKRLLSSKRFLATKSPDASMRLINMCGAFQLPGEKQRHLGKGQGWREGWWPGLSQRKNGASRERPKKTSGVTNISLPSAQKK